MQQDFNPEHQLLDHVAFDFKDLLQKKQKVYSDQVKLQKVETDSSGFGGKVTIGSHKSSTVLLPGVPEN